MVSSDTPLWEPSPAELEMSAMARFARHVAGRHGVRTAGYEDLWSWSVEHLDEFWASVWEFYDVQASRGYDAVLGDRSMPGATWFPGARLNYAEEVFRCSTDERPALVVVTEGAEPREVSWMELRSQAGALAGRLRDWGVRPGDRVAGYLPNIPEAVVALLATASVGAVWSCCPPDFGTQTVIDRFTQIEPVVLVVADGYRYGGRRIERSVEGEEIARALPSVRRVVSVPSLRPEASPPASAISWTDAVAAHADLVFEQVAFDHPLWILYSSGTTGLPKGIVHGHGGILLEHLKFIGLHSDVRPGDRYFWYTSTGWMVWNALVSSLRLGAIPVLYDGSPAWPGPGALWQLAERTRSTYLGIGAGYVTTSQKAELTPGTTHDLSSLRSVMVTGSPLPRAGWHWVQERVKPDVWLDAPSGGTDVCSAFVGACPLKPVYAGEMQCRLLGVSVEAWQEDGRPVVDEIGELVVTAPMPSMPLFFWNDTDGSRYRDAYFDTFPGVWRHGDWITLTSRGTAIVHGRSDSTINRHGVRMGSSDIHAAVELLEEIRESLVIGAELPDGDYYMPLFVVLSEGAVLDDPLRQRIVQSIRSALSPRHVPDEILAAPGIPHTLTGKRLEVPVKRLIQGMPVERAVNAGVVDDPSLLDYYAEVGRRIALRSSSG
jgi:acetoacetyl-CoA synthetase